MFMENIINFIENYKLRSRGGKIHSIYKDGITPQSVNLLQYYKISDSVSTNFDVKFIYVVKNFQ